MGTALSDDALEGFGIVQTYLFKDGISDSDRYLDLVKNFGELNSAAGKDAMKETLESAKTILQNGDLLDAGLPVSPKFAQIFPDMFQYKPLADFQFARIENGKCIVSEYDHYITPNSFGNATKAKEACQLPSRDGVSAADRARFRIKFKLEQVKDNLNIPRSRVHSEASNRDFLEPIVKDNLNEGGRCK